MSSALINHTHPSQKMLVAAGFFLLAVTAYPDTLDSRSANAAKVHAQTTCNATSSSQTEKR